MSKLSFYKDPVKDRYEAIGFFLGQFISSSLVEMVCNYLSAQIPNTDIKRFEDKFLSEMLEEDAHYKELDFSEKILSRSKFFYCSFTEVVFTSAKILYLNCNGVSFIDCNLYQCDLSFLTSKVNASVVFDRVNLGQVSLRKAKLPKAIFIDTDCRGTDFKDADLTAASFKQCCLLEAKLTKAILKDTVLNLFPSIFLSILEKSESREILLKNLLKYYNGEGGSEQDVKPAITKKHFFAVKEALSTLEDKLISSNKFSLLVTNLRTISAIKTPEDELINKSLDFVELTANCNYD